MANNKFLRQLKALWSRQSCPGVGPRRLHLERLEDRITPAGHDTLATAVGLTYDSSGHAQYSDSLPTSADKDYFRLTVPETGRLSAKVTPNNGNILDPRLTLYDGSGKLLIQSDDLAPGNPAAQIVQHLQPGTYYLSVSAEKEAPGLGGDRGFGLTTEFVSALPPFTTLPAGTNPASVALGDFNGDGFLDMVTANQGSNDVSVFLGRGDGLFQAPTSYTVGSSPQAVLVADVNHDHRPDLIIANHDSGTLSVLLGNGDGTFKPAITTLVGNHPLALAAGDFDGDGVPDVVAVGNDGVLWLRGHGDGTFGAPISLPAGTFPNGVVTGDFTHSGNLDLAVVNAGSDSVTILRGDGHGAFVVAQTAAVGALPLAIAVGDMNGDGYLDLVTADAGSKTKAGDVAVLLNDGTGHFAPARQTALVNHPLALALGDINGDGKLDAVVTSGSIDISVQQVVFLGLGDGSFRDPIPLGTGEYSLSVALGQINQDGHLDLVAANFTSSSVSVFLGRGDGSFVAPARFDVGNAPFATAVGDLNNDGLSDVVTANASSDSVSVLLSRGDGTFQPQISFAVGKSPHAVVMADLNKDGRLDLIVANTDSNDVSVLLGLGDGTFLQARRYAVGSKPVSLVVADFTGDGIPDLAVVNEGDDTVSVLAGKGDGSFQPEIHFSASPRYYGLAAGPVSYAIAAGDFNGDGRPDLVVTNLLFASNILGYTVSVLLNTGTGFAAPVGYVVGSASAAPFGVAVVELDGDHFPDLAVSNAGENTVAVLRGRGDGTFGSLVRYATGSSPHEVRGGDFNHDGFTDLITVNQGSGNVSVLLNDKHGGFLPATNFAVGSQPFGLGVGDFNNDGLLDVVAPLGAGDAVSVLLNQGNGQFQLSRPETGIEIRHIPYLADLDGDGLPDTLILDRSGDLLFRRGLPGGGFASAVVVNPNRPARDVALVHVLDKVKIAAVDAAGGTVSLYSWESGLTHSFQRTDLLAVGQLPVRIASADLGNGREDLVIADGFSGQVTILLQSALGAFDVRLDRQVGAGPSGIAFVGSGPFGPDIVVSDQASGDISVSLNDSSHSFTRQYRYRAGVGLFGMDASSSETTVRSLLQTVDVAAADFSADGTPDLLAVNRGNKSFTLLRGKGQGSYVDPATAPTFATSDQPGQSVVADFNGDGRPDVAILMKDRGEIWIYLNKNNTFAEPIKVPAGNDPEGFSVVDLNHDGNLDLLVGNAYGDILTLLGDGTGHFHEDRSRQQQVPLAVIDLNGDGYPDVVLASQNLDKVSVVFRKPGTTDFEKPVTIDTSQNKALLAPGAVALVDLNGDHIPDLVVASSGGNKVLVYQGLPGGQFAAPVSYAVGFNPVGVTVADLNGDGIPDLVVPNKGSNDVSVLLGSIDPGTGAWVATPGPRLKSGGAEPLSVAVRDTNGDHIPDLVVTNASGLIATLPGIGSSGLGTGFFQDNAPQIVDLGSTIVQAVFDLTTGRELVVRGDGGISAFDGASFTSVFVATGRAVTVLALTQGELVVGFDNGGLGLLESDVSGALTLAKEATGFVDEPSALAVLQSERGLEVYVTRSGSDIPLILTGADFIPVVAELGHTELAARGSTLTLPGADLTLVALLLPGTVTEPTTELVNLMPPDEVFSAFNPGFSQWTVPGVLFRGDLVTNGAMEETETLFENLQLQLGFLFAPGSPLNSLPSESPGKGPPPWLDEALDLWMVERLEDLGLPVRSPYEELLDQIRNQRQPLSPSGPGKAEGTLSSEEEELSRSDNEREDVSPRE